MTKIKYSEDTSVGENIEKQELSDTGDNCINWFQPILKIIWNYFIKIYVAILWLSNSTCTT